MSESNREKRVYMKPNKPATEMTEEEIKAFAEEMYNRIMGTLPERKVDDEMSVVKLYERATGTLFHDQ